MGSYTWNALDYAKHSSAQQTWAREMIRKLSLKGDDRVLDVGCGDGKVTAEIAGLLPHGSVVGIDSSEAMITQQLPEPIREGFISELVERYLEHHSVDEQGLTHVQMIRLEVEAKKFKLIPRLLAPQR